MSIIDHYKKKIEQEVLNNQWKWIKYLLIGFGALLILIWIAR